MMRSILCTVVLFGLATVPLPAQAQDDGHSAFAEQVHQLWSSYIDAKVQVVVDLPPDDGASGTLCRAEILDWLDRAHRYDDFVEMYLELDRSIPEPQARETLRNFFALRADPPSVFRDLARYEVDQACAAQSDHMVWFNITADRYDAMIDVMQAVPE